MNKERLVQIGKFLNDRLIIHRNVENNKKNIKGEKYGSRDNATTSRRERRLKRAK